MEPHVSHYLDARFDILDHRLPSLVRWPMMETVGVTGMISVVQQPSSVARITLFRLGRSFP